MKNNVKPREYLLKVLQQWEGFCREHRRFEKAIKDILEENERLKAEIETLKRK